MSQTRPDLPRLFDVLDATWPAAAKVDTGPWTLREGRGGGKRVSAATARDAWRLDDVTAADSAMRMMGQDPLFMIRPDLTPSDTTLDVTLAAQGYARADPTQIWLAPIDHLTDRSLPRVSAFAIWEPLAIMRELWEDGDIGAARQRVMNRAAPPKTGLFGRVSDKAAGVGFCAIHDDIAMVHALHILEQHRGKALGGWMMRCAALWAASKGARWIACAATEQNTAASALYRSLQMEVAGRYHYRILDSESDTQ
ncbi:GNAT superfamily N-acetyltransferase [Sagittula marina]|uniref:GNAT superfamily N-acetyltransferase n=1 Tax=Sagittula marina TaxID=943940 RepID=A0A7W6DPH8_9RHOB|nr:GNAT family N-acetyltransferase [Sagittula marina]MBB3986875.1 GNAT superfamily N-acetyltransferase [Sagittula marina]